jgi:hypothetical protein
MTPRRSSYARPVIVRGEQCTRVRSLSRCPRGSRERLPTARSLRSGEDRKPLKKVASKRARATTVGELLANRWQTAVRSAPGIEEAGCWTRPVLLVWGGAPRRNRTGDPILTMEPPGTAVRTPVSPGHARPSGPKLSVLFRRSYAFTLAPRLSVADVAAGRRARRSPLPGSVASRFVVSLAREVASRSATAGSESSVLRF